MDIGITTLQAVIFTLAILTVLICLAILYMIDDIINVIMKGVKERRARNNKHRPGINRDSDI